MKTIVTVIFGNNYNQYLIQLLIQSKYLVIEQNLAVHFLWTLYSQLKLDFAEAAVSVHILAEIIRS